jgi:hypothetical protein
MTLGTHEMLASLEVKGEATEDSESDSEIPACAAFKAPQSLAPSPHMAANTQNKLLTFKRNPVPKQNDDLKTQQCGTSKRTTVLNCQIKQRSR